MRSANGGGPTGLGARGGCVVVERGGAGPLPVLSLGVLACLLVIFATAPVYRDGVCTRVCACRALVAGVVGEVVFARCVCGTVRALVPCVFSPPPPVWCLSRPCVRELCG